MFRGKPYISEQNLAIELCYDRPSHTVQIYIFFVPIVMGKRFNFSLFKVLFFQRIYGPFQDSVNFDETLLPQIEQIFFYRVDGHGFEGLRDVAYFYRAFVFHERQYPFLPGVQIDRRVTWFGRA